VSYEKRVHAKGAALAWDAIRKVWTGRITGHSAFRIHEAGIPLPPSCDDLVAGFSYARGVLSGSESRDGVFSAATYSHPGLPLFDHQKAAIAAICATDAVFLAHEMGVGKTFACVAAFDRLGGEAIKVLVLCPRSVAPVWRREVAMHGAVPRRVVLLWEGSVAEKVKALRLQLDTAAATGEPVLAVINYESAWRQPMARLLLGEGWDVVVLDESHRIKNHRSKIGKFSRELSFAARRRICLTGTPMPSNPLDLFGQMAFLDPSVFGLNYWEFRSKYAVMGGFDKKQVVAFRHLDELYERWGVMTHRVCVDDVLDLPDATHVEIPVTLSSSASKTYRALEDSIAVQIAGGVITITNALTQLLRAQQLVGGSLTTDDGTVVTVDDGKRQALVDFLESLPTNEPVVVFCRFRADLAAVHAASTEVGRPSGELSGSRNELAVWQASGTDVLAVQIQSGGLGVDLSRARYAVYYSLGFSLGDYLQSLARIRRQGQTRKCFYYSLLAELDDGAKTVDHIVRTALLRKENVVGIVLAHFG